MAISNSTFHREIMWDGVLSALSNKKIPQLNTAHRPSAEDALGIHALSISESVFAKRD